MWTEAGPRAPAKRTLGTLPVTVHTLRTHPSIPAATPKGRYHKHLHFIKRETEAERCGDSSEVTQLVSNRAGTQAVGGPASRLSTTKASRRCWEGIGGWTPYLGFQARGQNSRHHLRSLRSAPRSSLVTLLRAEAPPPTAPSATSSAFEALLHLSPLHSTGAHTPTSLLGRALQMPMQPGLTAHGGGCGGWGAHLQK